MKKLGLGFILLFSIQLFAQDTITVQTFTYDSISTRRATFEFPEELDDKQFEKVLMYYNIKCDPLTPWDSYNCGEWDYLAYSHIYQHTGVYDSVIVNGPRYLLNGEEGTIAYTNTPYYNYYQAYEKFITYTSEVETDHSIGTATSTTNKPFGTSSQVQRTQLLWKNDELLAAGLTAGEIAKLRFNISELGETMGHLTVRIKHSSAESLETLDNEGWTTVFDRNTEFTATGVNTLDLTHPFDFDGTSHLLLDISFENGDAGATDNIITSSETGYNSAIYANEKLGHLNINPGEWAQAELSHYDFENEMTISFWANGDNDLLPANTSVIEAADSLNRRVANIHFPWSDSRNYWDAGKGSGYDRIDKLATPDEIELSWHHWAFTKNAVDGTMNIYKDGALWLTGSDKNRAVGEINKFIIGANKNFGNTWAGKLDEFRIWDVALSEATINDWKNKKVDATHPNFANLVTYYDFDGTPTVSDKSGNDRNAMANNSDMVILDAESFSGYTTSVNRPDITFVQGTYTSALDSVMIVDSTLATTSDLLEYAVDGRKFSIVDIQPVYTAGYSYLFNHIGEKIDSTAIAADVTLEPETLTYYKKPFEVVNKFEIGRFITPYGIGFDLGPNGFTYVYEVSDYQSLLHGDVDFAAHNTQELIDVQFKFIEGTPPRDVLSIEHIWNQSGSFLYKNLDDDVNLPAKEVALNPDGGMFKVRSRITGHGHNGANNCCEWGNGVGRDHELLVNGTLRDTWEIWQETECGDNPNTGQGGTWPYAREGWCPGDIVEDHEFDITPFVTPGTTATIDYDIEDVPAADPAQGNGNYVIAMHLITYGEPNFNLDAAVVDVLNPNNWEYYSKWNPTCQNPRILIKNTGATTLTSCKIDVWVGGPDNFVTIDWTGSLEFLEEEMVEIPVTAEWWYDFEGLMTFNAQVRNPNGGVDEYPNNDVYSVNFEASPVINDPFYIWFKTNNKANENEIYLKDQNGDVIYSRTSLTNNTDYKDTLDLPEGCYTLELYDSDHDGIGFWYSAAAEGETSGFLRLRKVGGSMIKVFDTDFGHYTKYSFSVGYALGQEENAPSSNLNVYPNPSNGSFNLTLDNFKGDNIKLSVYSELGALVYQENLLNGNADFSQHQLDLSSLGTGIYHISVVSNGQSSVKRIVIQ